MYMYNVHCIYCQDYKHGLWSVFTCWVHLFLELHFITLNLLDRQIGRVVTNPRYFLYNCCSFPSVKLKFDCGNITFLNNIVIKN